MSATEKPGTPTPSAYPRGTLVRGRTFEGGYLVEGFVCDECSHKDGYWWIDTVDPKASPANMRLVKPVEVLRTADWIAERLRMGQETTGAKINRRASLGARITELRFQLPELEKTARKTPAKTLKAEWAKVEAAKAHLPLVVAELTASEAEYERLRTEQPLTGPELAEKHGFKPHGRTEQPKGAAFRAMVEAVGPMDAGLLASAQPPSDVSPAYCPYCPHCHPRAAKETTACAHPSTTSVDGYDETKAWWSA